MYRLVCRACTKSNLLYKPFRCLLQVQSSGPRSARHLSARSGLSNYCRGNNRLFTSGHRGHFRISSRSRRAHLAAEWSTRSEGMWATGLFESTILSTPRNVQRYYHREQQVGLPVFFVTGLYIYIYIYITTDTPFHTRLVSKQRMHINLNCECYHVNMSTIDIFTFFRYSMSLANGSQILSPGWDSVAGWDPVTGLGSLNFQSLLNLTTFHC